MPSSLYEAPNNETDEKMRLYPHLRFSAQVHVTGWRVRGESMGGRSEVGVKGWRVWVSPMWRVRGESVGATGWRVRGESMGGGSEVGLWG